MMATEHKIKPKFATWTSQMAEHNGKTFVVLSMIWRTPEDSGDDYAEPHFRIKLEDGSEIEALPEEIFFGWMDGDEENE